jgi:large subunit ribosomal protein L5
MSNLREKYNSELKGVLQEKLGIKNVMAVPRLTKVVINMGVGEAANDKKHLESAVQNLTAIAGQKPVITKFKKSVANFKTRKGSNAGLKVTLRKNKMYEFIDRLVNIALPRIKDFRGLSPKGFDKFGNYTFGVKEHIIFPEVSFDRADKVRGLDIVVVIKAINKDHAFALLEKMNFPFIKKGDN